MILRLKEQLRPNLRGALFYVLFWGTAGIYHPFLGVYFTRLGFSGRAIGVLYALVPLMAFLAAPPLAILADRRDWRSGLLSTSLLAMIPVFALLSIPTSFTAIFLLMLLQALLRSPIEPVADSLIARMATRYELNYGRMRLWGSLSFALLVLAAGHAWQRFGFDAMFLVTALLMVFVAMSARLLEEPARDPLVTRRAFREVGLTPSMLALLAASFLNGASLGMFNAFAGIYMDYLGGTELLVGAIFTVAALCELPTMHYADSIFRRLGGPLTLVSAYLCMTLCYLGYALLPVPNLLLALSVLRGLGFGLFFIGTVRLIDERTPTEWSTTLQSIILGAGSLGLAQLIASPLAGLMYDTLTPASVFLVSALLTTLATTVLLTTRRYFSLALSPSP